MEVLDFFDHVGHFVWIYRSFDLLRSDQLINVVLCFTTHNVFKQIIIV
jgi:uncharacterized GH25 family protein